MIPPEENNHTSEWRCRIRLFPKSAIEDSYEGMVEIPGKSSCPKPVFDDKRRMASVIDVDACPAQALSLGKPAKKIPAPIRFFQIPSNELPAGFAKPIAR